MTGRSLLSQLSGHGDPTLDSLAQAFAQHTGADGAVIFLSDGQELTVGGCHAAHPGSARSLRVPLGQGVTGLVARNGHAMHLGMDLPRGRVHRHLLGVQDDTPLARMCLPARGLDRQILGVVAMHRPVGRPFSDQDLTRFQPLADLLGLRLQAQELIDAHRRDRDTLIAHAISAQEAERRRIAFDLHDGVATALASMSFHLNAAELALGEAESPAAVQITMARALADLAYTQTRAAITGLHSLVLDDLGLVAAIETLVETAPDVRAHMKADPPEAFEDVPDHAAAALFRIAQETTSNAIRHARADNVTVSLQRVGDTVVLSTTDDGVGFDVHQGAGTAGRDPPGGDPAGRPEAVARHLGLSSIAQRCALLGASLRIESMPSRGTTVIVELPISP